MVDNKNILIIGGDSRQLYMSDYFEHEGFITTIYGLPENRKKCTENLKKSAEASAIIVLPLPITRDNKYINSSIPVKESIDELSSMLSNKIILDRKSVV